MPPTLVAAGLLFFVRMRTHVSKGVVCFGCVVEAGTVETDSFAVQNKG
jgi:hypothetical protein